MWLGWVQTQHKHPTPASPPTHNGDAPPCTLDPMNPTTIALATIGVLAIVATLIVIAACISSNRRPTPKQGEQ